MSDVPPPPPTPASDEPAREYPPGTEPSQATTILVLGILGLVACQVLAPVAWYLANQYTAACEAAGIEPDGNAIVGRVLGMVGSVVLLLLGLVALVYVGFIFLYLLFMFAYVICVVLYVMFMMVFALLAGAGA